VASAAVPFDPPATSTDPGFKIADPSSVAVCSDRAAVIVPPEGQVALVPEPGIVNTSVVASVVVPLFPPVRSTLPFASVVAVWPSRALGRAVVVDQVSADVSNSWTLVRLVVPPELPPAIRTLLLKFVLLLVSSTAVCERRAEAMLLVTAVQVPVPDEGL